MTLNGAIMELVMLLEHPIMPVIFKPSIQKIIETVSECEEPERKKGKWINIREGNRADCDQCGQSGRAWMNFCFLCGADMRGENR